MDHEVLIEAMAVAGYDYADICSHDEWVNFFSDYGSFSFDSWQEVEDWLRYVVFDDADVAEAVEKILKGD